MKRTILTLLLALALTTPALATTKRCQPKCVHRTTACAKSASATFVATNLYTTLLESLELSAGFRWQTERDCLTRVIAVHDPFYLGAGVRLPLAESLDWHTQFDRDFTDEARWQLRTELSFTPFSR